MSSFEELKRRHVKEGTLYKDQDFPAIPSSVYYSTYNPYIDFLRPTEIARKLGREPEFIVKGQTRFDFVQGSIGNCWYIAAAATLATKPGLLDDVVPKDQSFDNGEYAGMFHFYFWRFGKWVEVIIDDRLPCKRGELMFCHNRDQKHEFWIALMEKAYAKLHGSYEALDGGWTEDAYVDFTGGVGERIDLRDRNKIPDNLFSIMLHDSKMKSLMACSIFATEETMESELNNGLVIGHAYSVTKVAKVNGDELVRLRNPWGKTEWNGPWSDKSQEWRQSSYYERVKLGVVIDNDGEFWMPFKDFVKNFDQFQICHLPGGSKFMEGKEWQQVSYHDAWVKGINAGGCGNYPFRELYWTNPQYKIKLTDADEDDGEDMCTLVVSLMQKHARSMRSVRKSDSTTVAMTFDLYKVKREGSEPLDGKNYSKYALLLARRGGVYKYYREITQTFKLKPGNYVVIASTFDAHKEMEFMLRMYTEKPATSLELDVETAPIYVPRPIEEVQETVLFEKYAGSDGLVDARELKKILNIAFEKELGTSDSFDLHSSRTVLAMHDLNGSGVLGKEEISQMWKELLIWKSVFTRFDKNKSGSIDVKEMRNVFESIGYSLNHTVMADIVRRFAGRSDNLTFPDFILIMSKVVYLMAIFSKYSNKDGLNGKADLSLDDFLHIIV